MLRASKTHQYDFGSPVISSENMETGGDPVRQVMVMHSQDLHHGLQTAQEHVQ